MFGKMAFSPKKNNIIIFTLVGITFCFIFCGLLIKSHALSTSEEQTEAVSILNNLDQKFDSLETIKLKVFRELKRPLQEQKDNWVYFYKKPDNYRIEYYSKPTRILTANEKEIIEYIPEAKKAMKTDITGLSGEQKAELHKQILTKVMLPGLRLGIDPNMKNGVSYKIEGTEAIGGREAIIIKGSSQDQGKQMVARFWIDKERNIFLKMESTRDGNFIASTEVKETQLVNDKYWFPKVVEVKHNSKTGMELARYRFNQVALNQEIPASKFNVELAPDVEVIKPEGR